MEHGLVKKISACLIAAAMAVMMVPAVPAAAAESSGEADGFTYVVAEDGSAIISGCIESSATAIVVPEVLDGHVVKGINFRAFQRQYGATSLSLPRTLEYIGFGYNIAKNDTSGLVGPGNLETIEVDPLNTSFAVVDNVLYTSDMKRLVEYPDGKQDVSFSFPEGVESIDANSFTNRHIESILIPSTFKELKFNVWASCDKLQRFDVAEGNASFSASGDVLFSDSGKTLAAYPSGMTAEEYSVPKKVTKILPDALFQQQHLKRVVVPSSVETIGRANFAICPSLLDVRLEGSKNYVVQNNALFTKDMKVLMAYFAGQACESYEVPPSVITINNTAFNNASIAKLSIPASVQDVETYSLHSTDIGTIYVATSEQYRLLSANDQYIIPYDASYPDRGGTTVVYSPGMVGVIDGGTGKEPVLNKSFKANTEEGKATFTLIAKYKGSKASMAAKPSKVSYAGEVRVDYYPLGKGRSVSFNTLRYNNRLYKITTVNRGVLRANKYVAAVALGSNVTSVSSGAFQGCKNLKNLYLGAGIKAIGKSAFYKCPKLASVIVASTGLRAGKVGASSFKGTAKKATFKVPKSKLKAYKKLFLKAGASKKASFKKA